MPMSNRPSSMESVSAADLETFPYADSRCSSLVSSNDLTSAVLLVMLNSDSCMLQR